MADNVDNDYKTELKKLMRTLFEFDYADLDFGIYRIMNKKRSEIERFIEKDLIDAVNVELGQYSEFNQQTLKKEIEVIQAEIKEKLGNDALDANEKIKPVIITTPFAKEIAGRYQVACEKLKEAELSNQHEAEIFTHIYQFFSRYYKDGDFISLRRYSQKEKYAIPYNGEEVLLHWANKDQYYIKTGENFNNYSFNIGEYTVEFLIKEAEGSLNNNKNENRFFVLASLDENIVYDDSIKTLTVFFEYRGLSKDEEKAYGTKNVQDAILTKIKTEILSQIKNSGLKAALDKVVNNETKRTILEKHLGTYTKKNTTDYFIHKDLKGFLTQELDFYIKNEVFHLDDLGTENELSVEQYVIRAKVMKKISLRIIDFLAQIENFQKMLFEKKKFVVSTNYCMTLDKVPEELYPEILKNNAQINEWKNLNFIQPDKQLTLSSYGNNEINEAYLQSYPYLVLDTKFFGQDFKDKLLAAFDDIDEATDGLMLDSENWQALGILKTKYENKIKCFYIDPPYNTGTDGFNYKDSYQHSSWMTLLNDRLFLASNLLSENGLISISIDDVEVSHLRLILNNVFNPENFLQHVIWKKRGGAPNDRIIGAIHEYVLMYAKNMSSLEIYPKGRNEKQLGRYKNPDNHPKGPWASDNLMANVKGGRYVKSLYFPIVNPNTGEEHYPSSGGNWRYNEKKIQQLLDNNEIYFGEDGKGRPKLKRFLCDVKDGVPYSSIWDTLPHNTSASKELEKIFGSINVFDTPKPPELLKEILKLTTINNDVVLDFFAGSGTTGHAVLNLNKENSGNRKYILVEMGEYFDTIMKRRIQKMMFSDNWKDGNPQSNDGISHIFKYQTLEQYEDTLNNIDFTDSGSVQRTLMDMEGYFLRYLLDFETRDSSPCRFNVTKLNKPFSYTLKIARGNELREEIVDLVETFNYLLGIHVKQIKTYDNKGTYYKVVVGKKDEEEIVTVWRDTANLDLEADKKFIEEQILSKLKPSKTYINADFHVERALPIEPEFMKLMGV